MSYFYMFCGSQQLILPSIKDSHIQPRKQFTFVSCFIRAEFDDFCFIQFLLVDVHKARRTCHADLMPTLAAQEPDDHYRLDYPRHLRPLSADQTA